MKTSRQEGSKNSSVDFTFLMERGGGIVNNSAERFPRKQTNTERRRDSRREGRATAQVGSEGCLQEGGNRKLRIWRTFTQGQA